MIYICIPVFNRISYTKKCLASIQQQNYKDYTVVICDDGSTDDTSEIIKSEFPEVVVLRGNGNLWWSGGTNRCIEYALQHGKHGDYIFTLNNDTELEKETLHTLTEFSQKNPRSIVSSGNYFNVDHNKIEANGFVVRNKWPFSLYHKPIFRWGQDVSNLEKRVHEVNSVSGKGVLFPVEVFKEVGLYEEKKLPQYHSDSVLTRKANDAGFKIFVNLDAVIYTDQSATGIGNENSENVSLGEFISSFFSIRSKNYLKGLYHRARLIYKYKWPVYFVFNIVSIKIKYFKRILRKGSN